MVEIFENDQDVLKFLLKSFWIKKFEPINRKKRKKKNCYFFKTVLKRSLTKYFLLSIY